VLAAFPVLLFRINRPEAIEDMTGWVAYWDVVMILAAVILAGLAIRTLDGRDRGLPE
jgi:hypothetical protein